MEQGRNTAAYNATIDVERSRMMAEAIICFLEAFLPRTFAMRLVVFTLFLAGVPGNVVREITGCPRSTTYSYLTLFSSLGHPGEIAGLLAMKRGGGRPSKLAGLADKIVEMIGGKNFRTLKEIACDIKEKHGISIHITNLGIFLKRLGIRRLKAGSLPAKADPEAQRDFYANILHPLMEKARERKIQLLFMDAAHFVHGGDFLGHVYGLARRFAKTFSGRKRHNVLGALDFVTKQIIAVTNETYINAESVCELLRRIAAQATQGMPVHVVLDNARYQKCKPVTDLASSLGIELVYLPPYSPNLNLIERVWKLVKSGLRNVYHPDFDSFRGSIDEFIGGTHTMHKAKMDSLIGEKVQLYDDLVQLTENSFAKPAKS